MECTHSKTRERTQERSALNRFLLHKYVLFNKSQSFILPCFWWRRTLPKSLRTKPHQQELSSSGVALPLLRGGGTCSPSALWVLSALPILRRAGPRSRNLFHPLIIPALEEFPSKERKASPHGEMLQCQCRDFSPWCHEGPQVL